MRHLSHYWGRLVPQLTRQERTQLEEALTNVGAVVLTENEATALWAHAIRDVPANIIQNCYCPSCTGLRKLAVLQTP